MQIPIGRSGFPTLSATQLRTYGAGGFRLAEQEESRGCPRQYKAKYVERRVPEKRAFPLVYGGLLHDCLFLMEEEAVGPEEALERLFPPDMPPEVWTEAIDDLRRYMERGASPTDRFGTIAIEQDLSALLYVDPDFGPVWFRGILDWLGIDLEDPSTLHLVDYKTNRHPPSVDDVRGDVQLKGYDWLVRQHWSQYMPTRVQKIVVHLDAIKFREVPVQFTSRQIEDWHDWAVTIARQILRDEEAKPVLNSGCAWCPVKDDCPAYEKLPETARELLDGRPADTDLPALIRWRDEANAARLLLEKGVADVDSKVTALAERLGRLEVGDQEWVMKQQWESDVDMARLHQLLGDLFYSVVRVSKKAVQEATANWDTTDAGAALACFRRWPGGSKVTRQRRKS